MKNHFIMSYFGNKRTEVEKLYEKIKDLIIDKTTIIEPFCGSSALSFYISTLHPKKYKYILNDNSAYLIELYNICKNNMKLDDFIDRLNKINEIIKKGQTPEERKKIYLSFYTNDNIYNWFCHSKIFCFRFGLYPLQHENRFKDYNFEDIKKSPIIKFLQSEDVLINHGCGVECYIKLGGMLTIDIELEDTEH